MTAAERACPACHAPLPEQAQFCLQCGHATPTDSRAPAGPAATEMAGVALVRSALADRYRIERVLGDGGMATVYLAEDLRHRRKVAVKVMRPELASVFGADRFLREIEVAAQLTHPHILPVHDSGAAHGLLYYVMPYVEGESLRERLAREGALPVDEAVRLAREVADALSHAHRRGIIHRDIKPANIMLGEGHALVADFGIARALDAEVALTGTGVAVGTPQYMSPEQASGSRDIDRRADVYAVGGVLYEMLAGEPPYSGETPQAILAKRLTEEVRPLADLRPDVPDTLVAVVTRAMARTPTARYPTADDLRGALDGVLATLHGRRTSTLPRWVRWRRAWLAAGVAAVGWAVITLVPALGSHRNAVSTRDVRLAVLPFENRGASADGYFVDGIADQVRGKLTGLGGFQVTARTSSDQYRHTTKSPQQIGRELGVDYLLIGTVNWARPQGSAGRVQVMPEVIDVRTGTATWQEAFDADLTDVFEVQAEIATRVAGALGVALGATEQQRLAERPTDDLVAYDFYLKGRAFWGADAASVREQAAQFEQAVALDSTFVEAWAALSRSLSTIYAYGAADATVAARARFAGERAIALDPRNSSGYAALAKYHLFVSRDVELARRQVTQALRRATNDPDILVTAADVERYAGRWDDALAHLRQARRLDPRNLRVASGLQMTLLWMRRYSEALTASEAALALAPGEPNVSQDKAMIYLALGDLAGARAVIRAIAPTVPRPALAALFGQYWDLHWVLEDDQRDMLLRLTPVAFDNDPVVWSAVLMQAWWLRGDSVRARAYADSCLAVVERQAQQTSDPNRVIILGLALAYRGRAAEAIAAGERALAPVPIDRDGQVGPYVQHQLVRIYLLAGQPDRALDLLEPLLRIPYYLSPGWLRIDPTFAPLKGHPRFERLIARS